MKAPARMVCTCLAWFGLISASGTLTAVRADDPLNGRRLFFTGTQREASALTGTTLSPDSLPDAVAQAPANADANDKELRTAGSQLRATGTSADPRDTRQPRHSKSRQENSVKSHEVYFTGLVAGSREARVLVNGLPCEPVSTLHDGKPDRLMSIHCHGVGNDRLRLALLSASGELLVTDSGGRVHRLLPGEAM